MMFCSTVRVCNKEVHGSGAFKVFKIIGFVILGLIGGTALAVIFGLVVMWLWNALMPDIFNLPEIGYWQAVGLVVLSHIFFGGKSGSNSFRERKKEKNKGNLYVNASAGGASVEVDKDFDCKGDGLHINRETKNKENHYESFREFWNGYGRDAFDKWLNRNNDSEVNPK